MYINTLRIHNLRCFRKAEARFLHPDRKEASKPSLKNINLLLGNNGSGKTTVLRAVALGILSPVIEGGGYVPYSMIRRVGTETEPQAVIEAGVSLHRQDLGSQSTAPPMPRTLKTSIDRIGSIEKLRAPKTTGRLWSDMFDDESPAFLVVGYGASRRVESSTTFDTSLRAKSRLLRYQRVAGLFEEHVTLTPLAAWLPELHTSNAGRYKQVTNLINRLLPEDTRFEGDLENGEYLFRRYDSTVPFGALSDGYRAFIGWVADLLYHVCMGCPSNTKLVDNRGIVLVDEIDLHLHPEWQRTVVPTISATFPRLQFILTSHSPIVTGTLEAENIHVMEVDESGASSLRQLEERVHGLNADQVLLSSYFGLSSTRDPGVVNELRSLSQQARKGDPEAALDYLRALSTGGDVRARAGSVRSSTRQSRQPRDEKPPGTRRK